MVCKTDGPRSILLSVRNPSTRLDGKAKDEEVDT
jgi:hypothetical protein